MTNQYLTIFGSALAIALLAIAYAVLCQTTRARRWFLAVFMLVPAAWLDLNWGGGLLAQWHTRNYSVTTGKVIAQEVLALSVGSHTDYDVHLTYQYTVNGRTLQGERIRLVDGTCGFSGASHVRWGHANGASIQVYYDPQNPTTAYLAVGLNQWDDFPTLAILAALNALLSYLWFMALFRSGPPTEMNNED